jgi:beta-glucosidase
LYGFGYGLSYTTFRYDQLTAPTVVKPGKNATVSVKVTNTGTRAGEEVVQLYLSHKDQSTRVPIRALKGFKRISLKPGESKIVQFNLTAENLSTIDYAGRAKQFPGKVVISVGGSQPDAQTNVDKKTVERSITIARL